MKITATSPLCNIHSVYMLLAFDAINLLEEFLWQSEESGICPEWTSNPSSTSAAGLRRDCMSTAPRLKGSWRRWEVLLPRLVVEGLRVVGEGVALRR